MSKFIKAIAALCVAFAAQSANALVITHSTGTFNTSNASTFDTATFSFASHFADTITVANFGSGNVHSHGTSYNFLMQVLSANTWVTVKSITVTGEHFFSNVYASPITFTGRMISGLRLTSSISVNQATHNVANNMTYTTFNNPANDVPEPASIALVGLALLGFAAARRKSK